MECKFITITVEAHYKVKSELLKHAWDLEFIDSYNF
jgi:hypothetical protein